MPDSQTPDGRLWLLRRAGWRDVRGFDQSGRAAAIQNTTEVGGVALVVTQQDRVQLEQLGARAVAGEIADTLRWFQQVADGATVTEVSDLEAITQSGVSRALARLEAEVGTPLLHRSGRTLRMTHAGSAFKGHVDTLLHQLDDGLAAVNQLIDPETGTVAIAFQPSLPDFSRRSGSRATICRPCAAS